MNDVWITRLFNIKCIVCDHITDDYYNYCENCGDCKINSILRWETEVIE